ncbi:lysophospholipid acyltransferase family protein [Collinsella provencensis]|uniref:lysophospholipid acyltransferase family protein n=1 Tax=Collinsella provencensis TaxID=1937461 RepID=UPI0018FF083A|nr:lysophospholipid acyltransferase family protein [Collinsella provencensis]
MAANTAVDASHVESNPHYDKGMSSFSLLDRAIYAFVMAVLWVFSKIMWRWNFEDADKLHDGVNGSVIICNHTSMAEVLPIVTHLWAMGRRVRPIFKSEFNKTGIVRWAFALAGGIPVDRGTADLSALRAAQHALQRGEDILIFPEGTRIRSDEQPVELHGGFALIAQMGKAPIAPMAVCGFRDITPLGKKVMRPMKCWMRAGDLVRLEDAPEGMKRRERTQWVEDEALRRMFEIRDALRVEHPGRH